MIICDQWKPTCLVEIASRKTENKVREFSVPLDIERQNQWFLDISGTKNFTPTSPSFFIFAAPGAEIRNSTSHAHVLTS